MAAGRPRRRHRRLFLLAAALGLAALAGSEWLLARRAATATGQAMQDAAARAAQVAALIDHRLAAAGHLHRLAQSWLLLHEAGNRAGRDELAADLAAFADAPHDDIIQASVIDRAGWLAYSTLTGDAEPLPLGDRDHFRVHAAGEPGPFISRPQLGRVSGRLLTQVSRALRSADGGFGGVGVVSIDLLGLSRKLAAARLRPHDRCLILHGTLRLAGSDIAPAEIGTRLAADDPLAALPAEASQGTLLRRAANGRPQAVGWTRLAGTPLLVACTDDRQEGDAAIAADARLMRLAVAALALLALLLARLVMLRRSRAEARHAAERAALAWELAERAHATFARRIAALPAIVYGGTYRADGTLRLRHVSDNAGRIIGWTAAELLAMPDHEALTDPAEAPARAAFHALARSAGEAQCEIRLRRPDGGWIWMRDSVRLHRLEDGSTEVVGTLSDISQERAMRAQLLSAGRLAALGEMATGLAHELNQPLAVMSLAAENALRSAQRLGPAALADIAPRLERIAGQALRARDIVGHLRTFGRADDGAPEPVALRAAVAGAQMLTDGALQAAGIQLCLDLPEGLPPVMARHATLEQALVHLLLNARDAIAEKMAAGQAGAGWIRLAARAAGEEVQLTVADSGGGLPDGQLDRLFEPFFTTKAPGHGTGLGLAFCQAAMRAFGGAISAANGPAGAVLTLVFRAAPIPAAADGASG